MIPPRRSAPAPRDTTVIGSTTGSVHRRGALAQPSRAKPREEPGPFFLWRGGTWPLPRSVPRAARGFSSPACMAFSEEIVREAWRRSGERCECKRESHGQPEGPLRASAPLDDARGVGRRGEVKGSQPLVFTQ